MNAQLHDKKQKVKYPDEQSSWAHIYILKMCIKITEVTAVLSICLNICLSTFAGQSWKLNMAVYLAIARGSWRQVSHVAEDYCSWVIASLQVLRSVKSISCNHVLYLKSLFFLEASGHSQFLSSLFYLLPYLNFEEWGMPLVQNVGVVCPFLG